MGKFIFLMATFNSYIKLPETKRSLKQSPIFYMDNQWFPKDTYSFNQSEKFDVSMDNEPFIV